MWECQQRHWKEKNAFLAPSWAGPSCYSLLVDLKIRGSPSSRIHWLCRGSESLYFYICQRSEEGDLSELRLQYIKHSIKAKWPSEPECPLRCFWLVCTLTLEYRGESLRSFSSKPPILQMRNLESKVLSLDTWEIQGHPSDSWLLI